MCSGLLVFTNQGPIVGQVHMGRNFKVIRGRLVLENPTGEVKGRASSSGFRADFGSASWPSSDFSSATCSGVRRTIQTGLPRHSTVIFSPGLSADTSASTDARAALARSDGTACRTGAALRPRRAADGVAHRQVAAQVRS